MAFNGQRLGTRRGVAPFHASANLHPSNDGDDRPRKKRKLTGPKERTTDRLDLRRDLTDADKPQLDRLLKTLHKKRKIVVIAGAGISVSAGIPDFRSSTGLFRSLRKEHKRISSGKDLFDASVYQDDSSTSSFHDMVRTLSQKTKNARPTAFHHLLATLAHEGRLLRLYTQNVDGIDTSLPPLKTEVPLPKKNPWPKTVQLHGGLDHMVCSKCNALSEFDADQFNGPVPPACPNCLENDSVRRVAEKRSHGIGRLRPRMVLYNEHNPDDEAIGSCVSSDLRTRPDAIIVAGTTLKVPGVRRITREMCATVRDRRDGVTIWINNDSEPVSGELANIWDLVVQGPCDEVARHAAMRRWDDPIVYKEVTDDELSKTKEKQKAEVVVGTPKKISQLQGSLPTPVQSPRMGPRPVIKEEPNEQPSTPSKKGTKRKPEDARPNAFEKLTVKPSPKVPAKRAQVQPKKTTGAQSRAKNPKKNTKQDNNTITNTYKATKNSSSRPRPSMKVNTKQDTEFIHYDGPQTVSAPSAENMDTIHVGRKVAPITPKKRPERITGIKAEYRTMIPISTSDPRNNHSPQRPEVESFTPVKPRTPSQQLHDEQAFSRYTPPTNESRPSSASSDIKTMKVSGFLN